MSKDELLAVLRQPRTDEEQSHVTAEGAILDYLNDPEITEAWIEAREVQNWWYA